MADADKTPKAEPYDNWGRTSQIDFAEHLDSIFYGLAINNNPWVDWYCRVYKIYIEPMRDNYDILDISYGFPSSAQERIIVDPSLFNSEEFGSLIGSKTDMNAFAIRFRLEDRGFIKKATLLTDKP